MNRFHNKDKISIPEINSCLLNMAEDYYWPLMEEVAPKLGSYEPLVEPAREVFEAIVEYVCRPLGDERTIAQDRITIHRNIVSGFAKIFEILEYLGFLLKREASRGMKSGGRGPVYAINLCSIIDQIPTKRLTIEMIDAWVGGRPDLAEIHTSSAAFSHISMPELQEDRDLEILGKGVEVLAKSRAYPYGLTEDKITRLKANNIRTVRELIATSDDRLLAIDMVGIATVKRMRDVSYQAVWM